MVRELLVKSRLTFGMAALIALVVVGCSSEVEEVVAPKKEAVVASKQKTGKSDINSLLPVDKETVRKYLQQLQAELKSGKTIEQIVQERSKGTVVVPTKRGFATTLAYSPVGYTSMPFLGAYEIPHPSYYGASVPCVSVLPTGSFGILASGNEMHLISHASIQSSLFAYPVNASYLHIMHELYLPDTQNNMTRVSITTLDYAPGYPTNMSANFAVGLPDGYSGKTGFVAFTYLPYNGGGHIQDPTGSYYTACGIFSITIP